MSLNLTIDYGVFPDSPYTPPFRLLHTKNKMNNQTRKILTFLMALFCFSLGIAGLYYQIILIPYASTILILLGIYFLTQLNKTGGKNGLVQKTRK